MFCLLIFVYFSINIAGNYRVFLHKKNRMVFEPNGFFIKNKGILQSTLAIGVKRSFKQVLFSAFP